MVPLVRDLGVPPTNRGITGCEAALVRSASLDARPLALPMLLSLALLSQKVRSRKFFFHRS